MHIIPAIDLYNGCVVRLKKGDYNQMTIYSDNPPLFSEKFQKSGAQYLHLVDLEGAKDGTTANINTVKTIVEQTNMRVEIGGGIRSDEIVEKYINIGVSRVILGTAAVEDRTFLRRMVGRYGDKIAVGVDIRDGFVAIKGWLETTALKCFDFCAELEDLGVKTVICTDISKDGMLGGTNIGLYKEMNEYFNIDIVASGGVSTIEDVKKLTEINMYGAILGKALYENTIDLAAAIKTARGSAQ